MEVLSHPQIVGFGLEFSEEFYDEGIRIRPDLDIRNTEAMTSVVLCQLCSHPDTWNPPCIVVA